VSFTQISSIYLLKEAFADPSMMFDREAPTMEANKEGNALSDLGKPITLNDAIALSVRSTMDLRGCCSFPSSRANISPLRVASNDNNVSAMLDTALLITQDWERLLRDGFDGHGTQ
jgi:hypothetical protein